jgi:hypothetical protein
LNPDPIGIYNPVESETGERNRKNLIFTRDAGILNLAGYPANPKAGYRKSGRISGRDRY